jgi:hypothetical protein
LRIPGKILLLLLLLCAGSCITQFIPETNDAEDFLVVDGLITDQNRSYTISLSRSSLLSSKFRKRPVSGGVLSVSDNLGNNFILKEKKPGRYVTDSLIFRGVTGRKYVLKIIAEGFNYVSDTVEMKAVPAIDTIEADMVYNDTYKMGQITPGYQVFVSTFDSTGKTGYYRWDYLETWEFQLPYNHPTMVNITCWKNDTSRTVFIKSTKSLAEDRVFRYPLSFISNETDRLTRKYSLLLKQYSLNENEYLYWEKIQKINQETGGLYDVVPISVKSNIKCIDDPAREVLGFFSVSAVSEIRFFLHPEIKDFPDWYKYCPHDTVPSWIANPRLFVSEFPIQDYMYPGQTTAYPYYIVTYNKRCWDCSLTGNKVKPAFWDSKENNSIPKDDFDFRK